MSDKYLFTPWPSLASFGKSITLPGGTLFYYDCKPANTDAASGNASGNASSDASCETSGLPTLVFIHGLGDEADSWRHVIPLLTAKGYRCIAIDLPGFGRSLWKGKISISNHANAVISVIQHCAENPVVLIGSSMGCGVAQLAALRFPALVKSLILVGGCFPIKGKMSMGILLFSMFGHRWYRSFRQNHEAAWKSLYAYYNDIEALSDEDKTFLRNRVIARVESDNQERGYFSSLRSITLSLMFARWPLSRKIKKYKGKIDLLWGEKDRVMPVEKSEPFRKLKPDVALSIIAGAGHLPQQDKPQETVEAILAVLG